MNYFVFGLHGCGKSTSIVKIIQKIRPKRVWLIAAEPFQKDPKTGQLVFPEHYQRTDISILDESRKADRIGACIVVDDSSQVRRHWKKFEPVLESPRQTAADFFLTFHGFALCPEQLFTYCNIAICFRTAATVPIHAKWGEKKQMQDALRILKERGNKHSCYLVNTEEGSVKIHLEGV